MNLDTAAVFDKCGCGLICFNHRFYTELSCMLEHPDCIGIYKTQKGFNGFVPDIGVLMEKIYPILVIWTRSIL